MQHAEKTNVEKVLITRKELKQMGVHVSNSTLLRWEEAGNFPRRIRLSNTSIAWEMVEIRNWITKKGEARFHPFEKG